MPEWLIGLVGIFLGWFLAYVSEEWRRSRHLDDYYRAIYVELRDIHSAVKTRSKAMEQTLKAFLGGATPEYAPSKISSHAYSQWFAQSLLRFTEGERLAITHIHDRLGGLNWKFGVIQDNWEFHSGDSAVDKENLRRTIQMTEGAYGDSREIDVMLELLLGQTKKHNPRASENEARLVKAQREINADLQKWAQEAVRDPKQK